MINREFRKVNILTYSTEVDDYGQSRQSTPSSVQVDMVCKIYVQNLTNDMRYVDVEMIGITKYAGITNKNVVEIDNVKYSVMYIIPSGKYYQILMKKCQ